LNTITFPGGDVVPALGMGTWNMGEDPAAQATEVATLQAGIDAGLRVIDTAEMYGDGASERMVGKAIAGRRDQVFLVSKVYPHNASRRAIGAACEDSLKRLATDRLDLYLLHWRGSVPLAEVLEGLRALQRSGKIRYFGVSNLDTAAMEQWWRLPGGAEVATDQILYNLTRRAVELDLLPWCRRHAVPVMAYSPLEQGELLADPRLQAFARRHGITPSHAALGWLLAQDGILAIPKTGSLARLQENLRAMAQPLTGPQCEELAHLFPAPATPQPLEMI
jgi:diketogulonate reductase-like aldo/keto reductase